MLPCKARNIIISTTPQLKTTDNFFNAFLDFINCSLLQEKKIANSWRFTQATEYITDAPKTQVVIWAIYIKNCSSTQGNSTTTIVVLINCTQKVSHSLSKQTRKYTRSQKIRMNSTSKKIKLPTKQQCTYITAVSLFPPHCPSKSTSHTAIHANMMCQTRIVLELCYFMKEY